MIERIVACFEIVLQIMHLEGNTKALQGTFFLESSTNDSKCNKLRSFAFEEREGKKLKYLE